MSQSQSCLLAEFLLQKQEEIKHEEKKIKHEEKKHLRVITVRAIMWIYKLNGGPKKYILPKVVQRKFKLTWVNIRAI